MRRVAWAAAVLLAGCQPYSTTPVLVPAPMTTQDVRSEVLSFVSLVNQHRKAVGCKPLTWNDRIAAVASAHSRDMARNNYMSHTNRQGQSPFDRLRAAGIPYRGAAENIAFGHPTGRSVLQGWLSSSSHRHNIENCSFDVHGVGLASSHWTHVLIRDP
jgi:uncharacterized protein YkwD